MDKFLTVFTYLHQTELKIKLFNNTIYLSWNTSIALSNDIIGDARLIELLNLTLLIRYCNSRIT